jgi:hypothetical protein
VTLCLCSHRHLPGRCPVTSCGCGSLRPDRRPRSEAPGRAMTLDQLLADIAAREAG